MTKKMFSAALMLFVVAGTWVFAVMAEPAKPKTVADEASHFGDKLVLIYFKGRSAEFAFTLVNAMFIDLNGQKMLSGMHADTGEASEWMRNRRAHVAWDAVESLTLYDSVDQYKQALEDASDTSL
jgi:hypothetical protein